MKRSQINAAVADAQLAFARHHWHLPPEPKWDVTGFGLGQFERYGLVLVNLTDLPEYCEKLMYAKAGQITPLHCHRQKQEDIICRIGTFAIRIVAQDDSGNPVSESLPVRVLINGNEQMVPGNTTLHIRQGERITLFPGVYHDFWPVSEYAIIGEVSTRNDDANDNYFENPDVGRYEAIEEDTPPIVKLLSE